jgi:hypothetical protein
VVRITRGARKTTSKVVRNAAHRRPAAVLVDQQLGDLALAQRQPGVRSRTVRIRSR